ncbi:MAG: glycosyltransferase [Candidatus Riflebacteria bacterium]|nr:glycosyltransferase [Candidatus Riflebacteria bacterium]
MSEAPNQYLFIYGLKPQTETFHICHYLCIESCFQVNYPDRILFFYQHEPYGHYWELAKRRLTLVKVNPDPALAQYDYGWRHRDCQPYRYAHISDFIRLDALLANGGVYADIDTIFVNPLPEALRKKPFVLGREDPVRCQESGLMLPSLCNALIISPPGAEFGRRWLQEMPKAFNGSWSNHSTLLPQRLSEEIPHAIHIEPSRSFYPYMWTREGIRAMLQERKLETDGIYSMHLWSHLWWSEQRRDFSDFHNGLLTERLIRDVDTTYNLIARRFLPERHGMERVSVVIPTRDRPAMLQEALGSVLAQSHSPCEIIIAENSVRPIQSEEISNLHPMISIIRVPGEHGPGSARNAGLQKASGDFVLFLDDDDLLDPLALESNISYFRADPGLDVVCNHSRAFYSPEMKGIEKFSLSNMEKVDRLDGKRLESDPIIGILRFPLKTSSCLVRRDCLGMVAFSEELWTGDDLMLWLSLVTSGHRIRLNPRILTHVRFHSGNLHAKPGFTDEMQRSYNLLLAGSLLRTSREKLACRISLFLHQLRLRQTACIRQLPGMLCHPIQLFNFLALLGSKKWETRHEVASGIPIL